MRISDWSSDVCSSDLVSKFKALAGAGIVLDVNTGEVLAMVSLPDFNPNNIADATEDELRNNVTQSVYELGSTFKPIPIAAALDMGVETSMSTRFDATKPIKVGRRSDEHPSELPSLMRNSDTVLCLNEQHKTHKAQPQHT